jgi:hypothetical protein
VLSSPHVKLAGAVEMSGVAADSMLSSPHLVSCVRRLSKLMLMKNFRKNMKGNIKVRKTLPVAGLSDTVGIYSFNKF